MVFLRLIQTKCHSLLGYAKGVAKAHIGPTNEDQQRTDRVTLCNQEMFGGGNDFEGSITGPHVIPCHCGGKSFPEQLKGLMPLINHTALNDRTTLENKTKVSGETIKQIF